MLLGLYDCYTSEEVGDVSKLMMFLFLSCVVQNSIRHNLSLHSRFMRVQNEGTGKSSWWIMNPDAARSVKTPRRPRALTLDTKSYERQRRRAVAMATAASAGGGSAAGGYGRPLQ